MAQLQLRPLGVGEIVDASFTVYRKRFGPMVAIALVLVFIPFLVSLVGGCSLGDTGSVTCSSAIGWLGYIVSSIGSIVATAAAVLVAAGAYAGVPSDWRLATRVGIRRILPIVGSTIVAGLLIFSPFVPGLVLMLLALFGADGESAGLEDLIFSAGIAVGGLALAILAIVPSIILAISFAVVWEALMVERTGPMESIKRSWRLVSGERWRLFGAVLLMVIIGAIVFGIMWLVLFLILSGLGMSEEIASYVVQQVVTLLSIPLTAAVGTVLYLDLRVRKESLDTERLGAALAEAG